MKRENLRKQAIAIGIVAAIAFGDTVPSFAAPVLSSTAVVKMTAPDMTDQVRVRRGRGFGVGAGVALGVLGAVAGAAAYRNQYYYGPGYYGSGYYGGPGYYGGGYYGGGYYGGPGYYGPGYDPGPAVALGIIGAAAGAIAGAPGIRGGRCWVVTDPDRSFGYWGRCR